MALQFNPPDWLIQEYMNRKSPAQQAADIVNQGVQAYSAYKEKQSQDQEKALGTSINAFKAGGPDLYAQVSKLTGLKNGPTVPGYAVLPQAAPQAAPDMPGMTPTEMQAQQSLPAEHPVIAHWNATMQPQANTVPGISPDAAAKFAQFGQQGEYGKEQRQNLMGEVTFAKGLKELSSDPNAPVPTMTSEQALAAGQINPKTKVIDTTARDQKYTNEQDRLEAQAIDRLSKLRGDQSLARTENQRDASIQAYNTIERVKTEGRDPTKLEYYDILGQMWKARTGASPTDQALRDLDQSTLHGKLGAAYTYFTGKAGGATTPEILQNIQDFAADSGQQADKFHSSYMDSHKLKPSGLENKRWDPIFNSHRGMSFTEATGYKPGSPAPQSAGALPAVGGTFQGGKVLSVKRIK